VTGQFSAADYRGPPRGSPKSDGLSAPPMLRPSLLCRTQKNPLHRNGQGSSGAGGESEFGRYQRASNLWKSAANVWSKKLTPHVPHLASKMGKTGGI
jgi:hypothetical protein